MKNFNIILALVVFMLYCSGCCKYREGLPFYIQNDSDQEIIATWNLYLPIPRENGCIKPPTQYEYEVLISSLMIRPYSKRNFESNRVREYMLTNPNDSLFVAIFNRIDVDTMSCEEFVQLFPLKKRMGSHVRGYGSLRLDIGLYAGLTMNLPQNMIWSVRKKNH